LGFIEICEGNDSSKCVWKAGNAQDLADFKAKLEESAQAAENGAAALEKAFGVNQGVGFRDAAKDLRTKAGTCKVK
jgi:hypothetical protein